MRVIILFATLAICMAGCTEKQNIVRSTENSGIHYSRSVNDPFAYYIVLRDANDEKEIRWIVNGKTVAENTSQFRYHFDGPGEYSICAVSVGQYSCTSVKVNDL